MFVEEELLEQDRLEIRRMSLFGRWFESLGNWSWHGFPAHENSAEQTEHGDSEMLNRQREQDAHAAHATID